MSVRRLVGGRANHVSASAYVQTLASRGQYHFSTEDAVKALDVSRMAARSALRRLKAKGRLATPFRGFHVIIPPEYQRLGCIPAEQFIPQLLERLAIPYYAGLLTAARYHGAAHHQPQVFQVIVPKNRPPIRCGRVGVDFVARHNAAEMPTVRVNTPRGYLAISSPEATAFDLVGYTDHCGGLDHVATVLTELEEKLSPEQLHLTAPLSPLPWTQRLGFLLDQMGHSDLTPRLASYVATRATQTAWLSPSEKRMRAERNPRWKLEVNVAVEADL